MKFIYGVPWTRPLPLLAGSVVGRVLAHCLVALKRTTSLPFQSVAASELSPGFLSFRQASAAAGASPTVFSFLFPLPICLPFFSCVLWIGDFSAGLRKLFLLGFVIGTRVLDCGVLNWAIAK